MSYNIGQFRRNQLSSYENKIQVVKEGSSVGVQTITIKTQEGLSLSDTALILKEKLKKGENYYFSFYMATDRAAQGPFIVYLYDSNNEVAQPLKRFDAGPGAFCEMVFTPNDINYNKLVLKKVTKSNASDKVVINSDYEGSYSSATYLNIF